ncbi:unnamed protein product [Pedinophyceae sp. YPF-701]|nr:unnamed protein product [Pedinophyceae sp. YPF-701]
MAPGPADSVAQRAFSDDSARHGAVLAPRASVDHNEVTVIPPEQLAAIVAAKLAGPRERKQQQQLLRARTISNASSSQRTIALSRAVSLPRGKPQPSPHAPVDFSGLDALEEDCSSASPSKDYRRSPSKPPCAACTGAFDGFSDDIATALPSDASSDGRTSLASRPPMLQARAINHISRVVTDVRKTANFYQRVLGFKEVVRPSSFNFNGAWLHGCGVGLHLIQGKPTERPAEIIPKSDHTSFQVDMHLHQVEDILSQLDMRYVKQIVREGAYLVTQLFFHDPDRNMIEVCDCDQLPLEFIAGAGWDESSLEEQVLGSRKFGPSGDELSEATNRALA